MGRISGIIIFLLTIIFSGCTTEIPYKGGTVSPSYVINCFFNPDSLFNLRLVKTQNIVSNDPLPVVDNAVVLIMDNDSVIIDVLNSKGNGYYGSETIKPFAGKNYLLKIINGSDVLWAKDSAMATVNLIKADTSSVIFEGERNFFQIKLNFKEPGTLKNYYHIYVIRKVRNYTLNDQNIPVDSNEQEEIIDLRSSDYVILINSNSKFTTKELLFDDDLINGNDVSITFGSFKVSQRTPKSRPLYLSVRFENLSLASYLYNTTLNEHLFYQNDPFAQSAEVKGNITGGFGIFGGYGSFEKRIYFK